MNKWLMVEKLSCETSQGNGAKKRRGSTVDYI